MKAVKKLIVLLFASLFLMGACSHEKQGERKEGGNPSSTSVSGLVLTAEIDKAASRVVLPLDRFVMTDQESFILINALTGATAKCARSELGIPWRGIPMEENVHPSRLMWHEMGPWTVDMASKYGFAMPAPEGTLRRNGILPSDDNQEEKPGINDGISDSDARKVRGNCIEGRDEVLQFDEVRLNLNRGPGYVEASNTREKVFKDGRTKQALQELYQCYRDNGMEPEGIIKETGEPGVDVRGANPLTINEEQIQLALKVVACKEKVDFVPRVARIWAEIQAPIIEEYAEEFLDQRNKIDSVLAKAKAFIAENPDVYQPAQK